MRLIKVDFHRVVGFNEDEFTARIPKDMLRYDTAFMSFQHPGIIAFPTFRTSTPNGLGNFGGKVTHARWDSFSIVLSVYPISDADAEFRKLDINRGHWHTFRHPSNRNGPWTASDLRRYEMEMFLNAKDIREF